LDEQMSPIALLSVSVEGAEDRLIAAFTLSAVPTPAWTLAFLERARYSVFEVTGACFARNRIRIRLPRREMATRVSLVAGARNHLMP
jgi:hypothetical protein